MLSLAGIRFRSVLADHGGPIQRIETGHFPVRGRPMVLANATLVPGLVRKGPLALYSTADGTGTDPVPGVARHKAVSEAMERWACDTVARSERAAEFGFDVDPSSNGMAAFPGLVARQARRAAVLEAIERFSLIGWWEGMMAGRNFATDWPGVSAVAIDGPLGGVTVVAYARTQWGGHVYGHAAEESFGAACERAVMELSRHEWILRRRWLHQVSGAADEPSNLFERRCLFFATEEGHDLFLSRATARPTRAAPRPEVICDREVPGPWSQYATVWRCALRPPTDGYLLGGDRFFFL